MRTTASYELFPDAPSERAMARARYLVREGRVADAEKAYRDLLAEHPDLKTGWAECFELLRRQGRTEDALRHAVWATETVPCSLSTGRSPWSPAPRLCACAGGFSETPDATRPPKWRTRGPPRRPSTRSSAPRRSGRLPPPGATLSTPRAGRTD